MLNIQLIEHEATAKRFDKFFYLPQEVGDPDGSQPSASAAQRTGSGREAARETLQSIACL